MTDARHTRELAGLRGADAGRFGGKSAALGELIAAGIPVPGGFALAADLYTAAVAPLGLDDTARDAAAIREAIRGVAVPDGIDAEIEQRYADLGGDDPPVAVRSSALGEDSAEATFAGQQETILWVKGAPAVLQAVRACWASLYSDEAISYRRRLGSGTGAPAMGVAVQRMVDAAVSGVMFTCNPVSGDRSMVAINAGWGLGLAVVGGEVTPDDHLVSKVTGEMVRETIGDKHVQYVRSADGRGTELVDVAPDRRGARCLDEAALAGLLALARRVEQHFGAPQDIEWAIDGGGEVFVLQARPVTGLPERQPKARPASAMEMVMGTFGANRGRGG
jgi:phosphoenolpyruvate synthase/pyruvate phosphate dikinase